MIPPRFLETLQFESGGAPILFLLDISLKGLVILAAALLLELAMRRATASSRHLLWSLTLGSLALLPFLTPVLPVWRLRVLPPLQEVVPSLVDSPAGAQPPVSMAAAPPAVPFQAGNVSQTLLPQSASPLAGPPAPPRASIPWSPADWKALAFLLWLAGASVVLLPFSIGLATLALRARRARRITGGPWPRMLNRVKSELGVARRVTLLESGRASIPMTWGFLHPVVQVPAGSERWPPGLRRCVLLHELAHVGRWDCLTQSLARVACAIHWFNPLAWLAARRMQVERERACDDEVLNAGSRASEYAAHLLEMARSQKGSRPWAHAALAMARRSQIEGRLLAILDSTRSRRPPRRWVMMAALAATAGLLLPVAALRPVAAERGAAPSTEAQGRRLSLKVLDRATGAPLSSVSLTRWVDGIRQDLTTDDSGRATIELPSPEPRVVSVATRRAGFVPMKFFFQNNPDGGIPSEYTIALEPGTSVGGRVLDEASQPVAGATVFLMASAGRKLPGIDLQDYPSKTNERGEWRCDVVPASPEFLSIRISHPDFAADVAYRTGPRALSQAMLRSREAVSLLKKGVAVEGVVVDREGKPIAGATVTQGSDLFGFNEPLAETGKPTRFETFWYFPRTTTDSAGRFRFPHASPGEMLLTVQAEGLAPALRKIQVGAGDGPLQFQLEPGRTIRVRVIDPAGRPVAGAFLAADRWRYERSLEWRGDTGEDGRVAWGSAPEDGLLFDIGKEGYETRSGMWIQPSSDEQVITLQPNLLVRGTVRDAATGEPIPKFRLVPGKKRKGSEDISWDRDHGMVCTLGRYQAAFEARSGARQILIEAEGYLTAHSSWLEPSSGPQQLDWQLQRGEGFSGLLRLPGGLPAAEGTVVVCLPSQDLRLRDGKIEGATEGLKVKTRPDGRFSLPPMAGPFWVVFLHEKGYAGVSSGELAGSPTVELKAWGRIAGTLRLGSAPGAGETIRYETRQEIVTGSPKEAPRIQASHWTETDGEGRFLLERVLPGSGRLARMVTVPLGVTIASHEAAVEAPSGGTARAVIGGTGRPVTGQLFVSPGGGEEVPWTRSELVARRKSPAGAERQSGEDQNYVARVEPNGRFRIEDVPAGSYVLEGRVNAPPGKYVGINELVARLSRDFEVPESVAGREAEPLELALVEAKIFQRARVGQPAPLFSVQSLDGSPIKLEDYRGKYVLLDFWATWCGPCRLGMETLKGIHQTFSKDERFVIMSLSLDKEIEAPRNYVAQEKLPWVHGFLGDWGQSRVASDYGVVGIPALMLVGPDGKVIAKNLMGVMTKQLVAEALGSPGPASVPLPSPGK